MSEQSDPDRYLSPPEGAHYTKMSLSWLRKRTAAGEIPHIKLGRRVVYDRLDLDDYMEEQKKKTAWRKISSTKRISRAPSCRWEPACSLGPNPQWE